jgi:hypothetical protein
LAVEVFAAPKQVNTAINAVMKGSKLITPIGGGVQIQARQALADQNMKKDEDGAVSKVRTAAGLENVAASQWWWD